MEKSGFQKNFESFSSHSRYVPLKAGPGFRTGQYIASLLVAEVQLSGLRIGMIR